MAASPRAGAWAQRGRGKEAESRAVLRTQEAEGETELEGERPALLQRAGTVLLIWKSQQDRMENTLPDSFVGHKIPERLLCTKFYSKC